MPLCDETCERFNRETNSNIGPIEVQIQRTRRRSRTSVSENSVPEKLPSNNSTIPQVQVTPPPQPSEPQKELQKEVEKPKKESMDFVLLLT